ncbi:PHP domain-containing protein [Methanomethylovorans sp.]|uniref:PHP domain-containing protein n=1 Tax=Methanomethylovorans sp. TaxID=2758717 RepID=UPI00351C6792
MELMDDGWQKADLHVHSSCSYDVPKSSTVHPQILFEKAMSKNMSYVTFTDHDTVEAFDILGWKKEKLVPGVELSVTDKSNVGHTVHINVFELDSEQLTDMKSIATKQQDIFMVIDFLKDNNLLYMYNHPFWFAVGEKPNLLAVPELAKHFPVIEYNMQDLKQKNLFAMALAHRFGKGMAVTTDSHTGGIGAVYTMAKGDDFREYFNNISKGNYYLVMDNPIWKHITQELSAWIELVFSTDRQVGAEFFTGVTLLDRAVRMVASDKLAGYPSVNRFTMKSIQKLSTSGLPFFLYMLSKRSQISEIKNIMNLQ